MYITQTATILHCTTDTWQHHSYTEQRVSGKITSPFWHANTGAGWCNMYFGQHWYEWFSFTFKIEYKVLDGFLSACTSERIGYAWQLFKISWSCQCCLSKWQSACANHCPKVRQLEIFFCISHENKVAFQSSRFSAANVAWWWGIWWVGQ